VLVIAVTCLLPEVLVSHPLFAFSDILSRKMKLQSSPDKNAARMETTLVTAQTKWSIDHAHCEIGFRVKHLMIAHVKGTFKT
jgi:polyisoprenoid-binding protein YceI